MGFLSETQIWEDSYNRLDDVDSRSDLLHKASRAFKIKTSRRPDASLHGPATRASYMEIVCIRLTIQTTVFMVWTLEALIWKLRAAIVFGQ
jgi:hypothetical protein